tara:strand:+ start:2187 stop:2342 length:156 start_codon:yes stop_codon:yes gene_type:complete
MDKTTEIIVKTQLDNIAKITNGKWCQVETLNSRGERTTKFVIEFEPPDDLK